MVIFVDMKNRTNKYLILSIGFLVFPFLLMSQNLIEINGKILNLYSKEPISYVNVFNLSTQRGTITNKDGFFRIYLSSIDDSVHISIIGYKDQFLQIKKDCKYYLILLEEQVYKINEFTYKPPDNSALYQLVDQCTKTIHYNEANSKAYFELKTFIQEQQVELLESYYNLNLNGPIINEMNFKTGRVAIQPYSNRFFVSLESSKAILTYNPYQKNELFPNNPLHFKDRKLKNYFYLHLSNNYFDQNGDSIVVIEYYPNKDKKYNYYGKIWINTNKKYVMKISLNCDSTDLSPFEPIFDSDFIKNISLNIVNTYTWNNGSCYFKHVDFNYNIDYLSRMGTSNQVQYKIKTQAVLYAYENENLFQIPEFSTSLKSKTDYHKINAFVYNDIFWKKNEEYIVHDSLNSNEKYFEHPNSITNLTLFDKNEQIKTGFFQNKYIKWSIERLKYKDFLNDTSKIHNTLNYYGEMNKISVYLFLDYIQYKDTLQITTSTIIDSYETFCYLPKDSIANCILNIYFDISEIERLKLVREIENMQKDREKMDLIFQKYQFNLLQKQEEFLKAVDKGNNKNELIKYNQYVKNELGIDNIEFFQLWK